MAGAPTGIDLFVDVPHDQWSRSVEFWCAAAAGVPSAPWGDAGQYVTVLPPAGDGWVHLQSVDGPAGVHLDLASTDRAAGQGSSLARGARTEWDGDEATAMRSPGGLVFCHRSGEHGQMVRADPTRMLDQVCIDIPAPLWEDEVEFWRGVTGRVLEPGRRPEFAFLGEEGQVRILLQRLDESQGQVRAHLDFAVADRAEEARRHEDLGADLLEVFDWWTVMRAPGGHVYCLTERDPGTGNVRGR